MTQAQESADLVMGRLRAEVEAMGYEEFWRVWDEHRAREAVAEKARRQADLDLKRDEDARFRAVLARLDGLIERMRESNRRLIQRHEARIASMDARRTP